MAVVRIPRGFSLMKSKRTLMDGSVWTARRYIVVILERLKKFAIIFQWEPFDTYNRVTFHGLIVGADLIGLADRAVHWFAEANCPKEEVVSRSCLSPIYTGNQINIQLDMYGRINTYKFHDFLGRLIRLFCYLGDKCSAALALVAVSKIHTPEKGIL